MFLNRRVPFVWGVTFVLCVTMAATAKFVGGRMIFNGARRPARGPSGSPMHCRTTPGTTGGFTRAAGFSRTMTCLSIARVRC